ncbi:MAG TPA: SCO family protein, partial [Burkholderiaceae bacterium]
MPMIPHRLCVRLICAAAIAAQGLVFESCIAAESSAASGIAGDSVYQLPLTLTDQNNRAFALAELRGKPVIVSMFYNSCKFVCPMLIDTIRDTVQALKPAHRDKITVL